MCPATNVSSDRWRWSRGGVPSGQWVASGQVLKGPSQPSGDVGAVNILLWRVALVMLAHFMKTSMTQSLGKLHRWIMVDYGLGLR